MCGLFSFAARDANSTVDVSLLRKLALANERRGPHAHGWAWMDAAGSVFAYHGLGRVSLNLHHLEMVEGAVLVFGHVRWATRGRKDDADCVHPWQVFDDGWLAHNGTIEYASDFRREWGLQPLTPCDSELLALSVRESDRPRRIDRLIEAMAWAKEYGEQKLDHAIMALWPRRLAVLRSGKPMHVGGNRRGLYYSSVLDDALPRGVELPDNTAVVHSFDAKGQGRYAVRSILPECGYRKAAAESAIAGETAAPAPAPVEDRPEVGDLHRVFVYGSLKRGFGNSHYLRGSAYRGEARTTAGGYRMVSLGSFPAVVRAEDGEPVQGEVYEVNAETFASLDRLEGHPGFYRREVVQTSRGAAWCYLMTAGKATGRPLVEKNFWQKD